MEQEKFFRQSYEDAWSDYEYSCQNYIADKWDFIILTAANERQADSYRMQIEKRREENRLPLGTEIFVIADYQNERIGSGGAFFNVLRFLECEMRVEVDSKKILLINSGGDSKRIPQYSACGKLFSPVPRLIQNKFVSSIFDELIIAASGIPARTGNGIMVFPSDTVMLFNPLQLDLISCDAAALSM